MFNEQHVDVPRLKIQPLQRAYADHKKCFKLCLRSFDTGTLTQTQNRCIIECLTKYRDSERYLAQKMHKVMSQQALRSPEIKSLYNGAQQQNGIAEQKI